MSPDEELRPLPFDGMSRYRVNRQGTVFGVFPEKGRRPKPKNAVSLRDVERQWDQRGEVGWRRRLLRGERGSAVVLACWAPLTGPDTPRAEYQTAGGKITERPEPETTQADQFPLAGDAQSGWYILDAAREVVGDDGGITRRDGRLYFHGPSVAEFVFNR
jgi:transposase InsO family protein